jgi:hypothetical protein
MVDPSGQFRVVPISEGGNTDAHFRAVIAARYVAVDVQLSGDELAADEAFTAEYGDRVGPGRYRHCSLADKLGEDGMVRVRRFVAALLLSLSGEGDRLVWFVNGVDDVCDDEPSEDRLVLRGCVGDARLNGSFALFGGERDALVYHCQRLGHYDRVRGLVGPGLSLAQVSTKLTIGSPVPTCSPRLEVGQYRFAALEATLPLVRLFFEELANGSRLRLVSGALSLEDITTTVAQARTVVA